MVTSCCVAGCNSKRNSPEARFFRFPSVLKNDKDSISLSKRRRELWIARINRKELNESTLAEQRVCNKHFIRGQPAKLFQSTDPDWAPSQQLGYEFRFDGQSSFDRYERRMKRAETMSSTSSTETVAKKKKKQDDVDADDKKAEGTEPLSNLLMTLNHNIVSLYTHKHLIMS